MTEIDREKLLSLAIKRYSKESDRRDRMLSKDLEAYRRLRKNGLQPPRVDGSDRLEREAVSPIEIETGVVNSGLPPRERKEMVKKIQEVMDR